MDALLLTIYFLVVLYVLYQMALSLENKLEDKVIIHVDTDFLAEQTQAQLSCQADAKNIKAVVDEIGLKDSKVKYKALSLVVKKRLTREQLNSPEVLKLKGMGLDEKAIIELLQKRINIRVSPINQQPLRPISYLSITATNNTDDIQLYINWDHSSLEMYKQGHRIIRSTPNMPRDLSQAQIFSLVNPGQSVTSDVTIENNYVHNIETNQMQLARPLVDLKDRVEFSQMTDPTTDEKNIQPLYNLDLMIGIKHVTEPNEKLINLLVPFSFELEIKPDKPAFPPMRWLLRHFGLRNH
ncbi:MAG: hypothetical protein AAFY72_17700 [Cyanobacteria bacterium J06649_4]